MSDYISFVVTWWNVLWFLKENYLHGYTSTPLWIYRLGKEKWWLFAASVVIAFKCTSIEVNVADNSKSHISAWNNDQLPIYEPDLDDVLKQCRYKNLFFSTNWCWSDILDPYYGTFSFNIHHIPMSIYTITLFCAGKVTYNIFVCVNKIPFACNCID